MYDDLDLRDPEYRGKHLKNYVTEKERKREWEHKIFLFDANKSSDLDFVNSKLNQVVNVYEHSLSDFEFNSKKIIKHCKKNYGTVLSIFTLGQSISFRVHKDQKEPFSLSLFKFLVNYSMLIIPITLGCDMTDWEPWTPHRWTSSGWVNQIDKYIEMARPKANMRAICECIELSKYIMNLWVDQVGDRIGLTISNNEFIELMKRSKFAYETITCSFDIPENISPTDLENLTTERASKLISFINEQTDLSMSTYTRNNLFNLTQFREYAVHICHKPDLNGNTVPYTYPTNIIMGISDIRATMLEAQGGLKAEITKMNVSKAGTLERSMMMMMTPVRYVDNDYECDSRHFRKRFIANNKDLEKLDGRVYTLDPDSDEFWILHPSNVGLIGKYIYLKTVITCTHPRRNEGYVCSACYGKLMASLNCDIHIGRIAAAESSDEIEQKLLSAKHALDTRTVRIEFDDMFDRYFEVGNGQIHLNADMIEDSNDPNSDFHHLYLEFYPHMMGKNQDGESRHFDRSFNEIIVYDDRDDSRINISEKNGVVLYLSPEFNDDHFLPALRYRDSKDYIRIPFSDICDLGKVVTEVLFEYSYKNNELASPLLTLEKIMFNGETIGAFESYNDCLDTVIPLFVKGGIHIPDYQTELLISKMITSLDGSPVDWNDPNPKYNFISINKSIQKNPSALTSVIYRESGAQIAGAGGTYEKTSTSSYDWFILDNNKDSPWC